MLILKIKKILKKYFDVFLNIFFLKKHHALALFFLNLILN
jgi:hypothetical protein